MQPEEDPEARIRELERSLNDQAQSSELGTRQYSGGAYIPPPPGPAYTPPAYGTPPYGIPEYSTQPYPTPGYGNQPYQTQFPTPPRKTGSGIPWLVFGLIAFVLMAVAGGVIAVTMKVWNSGSDVSSGGGSIEMPSVPSISIPSSIPGIPAPSAPSAPETPTAVPGAEVTVSGMGETKTIVCNDGPVSVSGISNNVTIIGHCVTVTVSGMSNQLTLDAADTITASGFDNLVTYHSGAPQVDNSGGNNVVEQG